MAFHPSRPEDLRGFCREFTNKQIKNVLCLFGCVTEMEDPEQRDKATVDRLGDNS